MAISALRIRAGFDVLGVHELCCYGSIFWRVIHIWSSFRVCLKMGPMGFSYILRIISIISQSTLGFPNMSREMWMPSSGISFPKPAGQICHCDHSECMPSWDSLCLVEACGSWSCDQFLFFSNEFSNAEQNATFNLANGSFYDSKSQIMLRRWSLELRREARVSSMGVIEIYAIRYTYSMNIYCKMNDRTNIFQVSTGEI